LHTKGNSLGRVLILFYAEKLLELNNPRMAFALTGLKVIAGQSTAFVKREHKQLRNVKISQFVPTAL
jgi:hypothetical protein